jgi:putative ABC transport system substrate-binding protein
VRRRDFILGLGGAAAFSPIWPMAAHTQARTPVIGFLNNQSPDTNADRLRAFRQGLKDTGYVEGENVTIEYRWAENQPDRMPMLATELVHRQVALIVTTIGTAPALVAKSATTTIPIVFAVGEDPVRLGLVANLARPGGNLTGINYFNSELVAKRLELLREMVPAATRVAVLVYPTGPTAETTMRDAEPAARAMGIQVQIFRAGTAARSMRPSQLWSRSGPMPCTWVTRPSSTAGVCNWSTRPRYTSSLRHIRNVNIPRSAGS